MRLKYAKRLVEILLRERVVLVIVAAGASQGEAHEDGGGGLRAVGHVLDAILFGDDAAFAGGAVIAVEAGGDALLEGGIGQQIAGQLLDGEPVVGQIAVEGVDDPVAPAPHVARAVGLVAVGVAVARRFHPAKGHALAVARRGEQAVDDLAVGGGRGVAQEGVYLAQVWAAGR